MLKSFIRFTTQDYTLQYQEECLPEYSEDCNQDVESPMLIKSGDVIKWIMNSSQVLLNGLVLSDLKVGLTKCGVLYAANIGTIEQFESQLYIVANIPEVVEDCYEFIIYTPYTNADCSQFEGMTIQEVIDTGVLIGDILNCTVENFYP